MNPVDSDVLLARLTREMFRIRTWIIITTEVHICVFTLQ